MILVVCSNWRLRRIPNVNDSLSTGMEELLLYNPVICVMRESLCVALADEWIAHEQRCYGQSIGCKYTLVKSRSVSWSIERV